MDGEFTPIQALIQEIIGGTWVNLASDIEHVSDIETNPSRKGKDQVYKTQFIF